VILPLLLELGVSLSKTKFYTECNEKTHELLRDAPWTAYDLWKERGGNEEMLKLLDPLKIKRPLKLEGDG